MDSNHQVLLFYNYTPITDPEEEQQRQLDRCKELGITGRMIIAEEGINATFEANGEAAEQYVEWLLNDPRFASTHIKRSIGTGDTFPKLSIKVRPEIVSLHLGSDDIDPNQTTGKYLQAGQLHQWINSDKEFYIVDMRNDYEFQVGHFANSVLPELTNFRDLPKVLPELEHLKNKTVLTVCTGGIRCEKASGFLVTQGFNDVYQLAGGIHTYMEKYPNEDFLGKLYVFDGRVTMGFNAPDQKYEVIGKCTHCGKPSDLILDCSANHCTSQQNIRHFVCCDNCMDEAGTAKCVNCK
jgi:UPF0176 protein